MTCPFCREEISPYPDELDAHALDCARRPALGIELFLLDERETWGVPAANTCEAMARAGMA